MTLSYRISHQVARACGASRVAAISTCVAALLSGCTGFGGLSSQTRAGDSGLYEGQPATVFATEYPVESAEDARQRASAAMSEGNVDLALFMLVEAVELDPSDDESLATIGSIHARRGNTELANLAFDRSIQIDPENAVALQGAGIARFEAGRVAEAESLLERAVAVDSELWRAHNVLGVIADTRGDYVGAAQHYSTALASRPGTVSILNNRGFSKYMSGDYAAAKADFLAILQSDPNHPKAWQNLALVHARQRDYDSAVQAMSRVVDAHVAANDVGYIAMLDGEYDDAEYLFAEAQRLSPRYYKTAADNAAELRRRRGGESVLAVER